MFDLVVREYRDDDGSEIHSGKHLSNLEVVVPENDHSAVPEVKVETKIK